ncbi:ATP-dependent rRNA helicase [Venturia inaequalis]|nr:ATP-dependent rRNA helicase [Venturia inaequalis]
MGPTPNGDAHPTPHREPFPRRDYNNTASLEQSENLARPKLLLNEPQQQSTEMEDSKKLALVENSNGSFERASQTKSSIGTSTVIKIPVTFFTLARETRQAILYDTFEASPWYFGLDHQEQDLKCWAAKLMDAHESVADDIAYVAKLWRTDIYNEWSSRKRLAGDEYFMALFRGREWSPFYLAIHLEEELKRGSRQFTHREPVPPPTRSKTPFVGPYATFLTLPHELRQMIILDFWLSQSETQGSLNHLFCPLDLKLREPRAWLNKISEAVPEAVEDVESVKDRVAKQIIKANVARGGLPDWYANKYRGGSCLPAELKGKEHLTLMGRGELGTVDRHRVSEYGDKNVVEPSWVLNVET